MFLAKKLEMIKFCKYNAVVERSVIRASAKHVILPRIIVGKMKERE